MSSTFNIKTVYLTLHGFHAVVFSAHLNAYMNLYFQIARRYLFSKKSTNAINIISWISIAGISIGTASLILILSVFNGFEELMSGIFNAFNPDLKVRYIDGKSFDEDPEKIAQLKSLEGVAEVSRTLEEIALFQYLEIQEIGILKGVDSEYNRATQIDSAIRKGAFYLEKDGMNFGVIGTGMANKLDVNIHDQFIPIDVFIPRRKSSGPLAKDFKVSLVYPAGTFTVQNEHDYEYILCDLELLRNLMDDKTRIGNLEIKLSPKTNEKKLRQQILEIMGSNFEIKNRYEQDEAFLKIMNIEKWMSFAIVSLTLLLIAFNLVGSLWMIVLEKKQDISILKSMGSTNFQIRFLFLMEGLFICFIGILLGLFIAGLLYIAQKQFGLVPIPEGFIIDAYPIKMKFTDVMVVILTVFIIGTGASLPSAHRASKISAFVRAE